MALQRFKLFAINIPFKLEFTHAQAKRNFSDSLILEVEGEDGIKGFGEAVIRDYVSGVLRNGGHARSSMEIAKEVIATVLSPFRNGKFAGETLRVETIENYFNGLTVDVSQLPLVCASELAFLDYLCRKSNRDIYELLARDPVRERLYYGGTLPILPLDIAKKILFLFKDMRISNLRVKLNNDTGYTEKILTVARNVLGSEFDIRVDANSSWNLEVAFKQMRLLKKFGIEIIEDPLKDEARDFPLLFEKAEASDFTFVSDESMLDFDDMERIYREKYFSMVNIRLSKNGGIFRSLKIAKMAEERGIKYQVGCHVGETGILSAAGRVIASLLKDPVYIDGSYDNYILSDNVTTENMGFGFKGEARIIRGKYLGYNVDIDKVRRLSVETSEYF